MAAQIIEKTQSSLFDIKPYITGKKRVRYKVPTYTKSYEDYSGESLKIVDNLEYESDYQKLDKIYLQIYNYGGHEILNSNSKEDKVKEVGQLRFWTIEYDKAPYEYEGETYEGQEFTVRGAEIIGTENWDIDKRIEIHERLLRLLRKSRSVEEAMRLVR